MDALGSGRRQDEGAGNTDGRGPAVPAASSTGVQTVQDIDLRSELVGVVLMHASLSHFV